MDRTGFDIFVTPGRSWPARCLMELQSLLNKTDMIFHRFDGRIEDHGDHISVETPDNPGYYWGNYLIFDRAPARDDIVRWRERFKARFGANPEIRHETFCWETSDSAEPQIADFLKEGFLLGKQVTMATDRLLYPKKWNARIEIRDLESSSDWDAALEYQVLMHRGEFEPGEYREYRRKKNERYRRMISQGLGCWFGAYLDGRLVGDLGLFSDNGLGRFQLVSTDPEYRRKGICSTLLYYAGSFGFAKMGLQTLVINADGDYFAKDIYQSLGFEVREHTLGLERRPR